jgi:hypothetical protein
MDMTTVGKVLVFFNLVFSLVVGWLIIQVWTASTNWRDAYQKQKDATDIAEKSETAMKDDRQRMLNDRVAMDQEIKAGAGAPGFTWSDLANIKEGDDAKEKIRKVQNALVAAKKDLDAKNTEITNLAKKVQTAEEESAKHAAVAKAAEIEVARRQADVEKMRGTLVAEVQKNLDLVKAAAKDRDEANAARIQLKATLDRNTRLEEQLQETAKDLARVKANLGTTTAQQAGRGGKNPPPEMIEGKVAMIDNSGLIKLTVGSDRGLQRNHTMEAFRLGSGPNQSRYLGTLRIIEVGPNEAVAQPMGKMNEPLRPGDLVASRIFGG